MLKLFSKFGLCFLCWEDWIVTSPFLHFSLLPCCKRIKIKTLTDTSSILSRIVPDSVISYNKTIMQCEVLTLWPSFGSLLEYLHLRCLKWKPHQAARNASVFTRSWWFLIIGSRFRSFIWFQNQLSVLY